MNYDIRIEDDAGNAYYPHGNAKTNFMSDGKDVETAIGQLKSERLSENLEVYVSPSGSDTTGDGTQLKPYATIQKAVNSIPFTSNKKVPWIKIAGGIYNEEVMFNTMFNGAMIVDLLGPVTINGRIQIYTIPYLSIQGASLALNSDNMSAIYVSNTCFLNIATSVTINGCVNGLTVTNGARVKTNSSLCLLTVNNAVSSAIYVLDSGTANFNGGISGLGNTRAFSSNGGIIFVNTENIVANTKIVKANGGKILTGAGVDLI